MLRATGPGGVIDVSHPPGCLPQGAYGVTPFIYKAQFCYHGFLIHKVRVIIPSSSHGDASVPAPLTCTQSWKEKSDSEKLTMRSKQNGCGRGVHSYLKENGVQTTRPDCPWTKN